MDREDECQVSALPVSFRCHGHAADNRVDPLDQTVLTYMDSGESIPCDLVVLKDEHGNVITVT